MHLICQGNIKGFYFVSIVKKWLYPYQVAQPEPLEKKKPLQGNRGWLNLKTIAALSYTHHSNVSAFYCLCFIQFLEMFDTNNVTSTNANILTINTLNIHFAIA